MTKEDEDFVEYMNYLCDIIESVDTTGKIVTESALINYDKNKAEKNKRESS